jgi:uncharacterized protein YukE
MANRTGLSNEENTRLISALEENAEVMPQTVIRHRQQISANMGKEWAGAGRQAYELVADKIQEAAIKCSNVVENLAESVLKGTNQLNAADEEQNRQMNNLAGLLNIKAP